MTDPRQAAVDRDQEDRRQLRETNAALVASSIRQQERTEQAEKGEATARAGEDHYRALYELAQLAETAARESEERFRMLADNISQFAWTADAAGSIYWYNRRWYDYTGTTPEEMRGDGWKEMHHPAHLDRVLRSIQHALDTGTVWEDTFPLRGKGGEYRWFLSRSVPIRDGSGSIVRWFGTNTDIHAIKQAEAAAARLAAIVTYSEDAIISKDLDGIITSWNRGAEHLFGYSAEEAVGRSITLLIPEDHLDEEPEILGRVRRGEAVEHYETVRRRKDGSLLDISLTVSPIRDPAGKIIGASKIARDISDRRRADSTAKEQAKTLADLHRRKDEFLAMLSHELRNPLAPIMNAVQLLRLQKDGSELQKEAHAMIERQVSQLARLVDDLLEVSRITTGRIHLQQERLDLRNIVERAIATTRTLCGQKSQSVASSLPAEPVFVYGDSMRLDQVVVNLLNNACKYTDHKGHIWVGLARTGDEAELRIRDNGIGIAAELLPHIFDLFTQGDKSLDRSQGGLGIGLALVQSLVTMHRGRVEAFSTPGQGSEFIVHLPVMLSTPAAPTPAAEIADSATRSLKVLVVDDNVDAAKGIARLLGSYGHEVQVAHDGVGAMQAALKFVPHLVLLDIGLPVINGFQVAQWIREQPALQSVVLVALTGYGQESDRQRSQEAGFDHHLVKPADFAKVQQILATVAQRAH